MGEIELSAGGVGRCRGKLVAQSVEVIDRCGVRHGVILGDCLDLSSLAGGDGEALLLHGRAADNTKVGYRGRFDGRIVGYQQLQHAMFCTLDCRFKPRRATKGPEEKRRCYACSTRYRVCNGRRSPVFWSVEGECLAQESYARRTYHEEPSRNCLTETTTATDKQNRTVAHGGAVLLFWSVGLFHVISFLVR